MSQSFDLSGVTTITYNGEDVSKLMLDGVRIWERYTATQQVWVSSGYTESYWLNRGHHPQSFSYGENSGWYPTSYYYYWSANHGTGWTISQTDYGTGWSTQQRGNTKYWKSSFQWGAANGNQDRYYMAYATLETRWVDTSSWQTQSYTAYYY